MLKRRKNKTAAGKRAKRRKKMLKTKYGQRPLRHSKKGVNSCILAVVCLVFLIFMIIASCLSKGDVSMFAGFACIAVAAVSAKGLHMAVKGFKEREKNYITCKVGMGLNIFLLFMIVLIFIRGLL